MPRYSMVAPTFNPVDYKTRIQPLEQYKEEYDKRMDALDEQDVPASTIGGLIDENQDPELARVYKDYNDKMVNTANELLRTGDLGSSRRALRELRSDYANKLIPIQQAFNSRAEAAKSFRDAKIKDPSLVGNNPINTNLGSWMNGKAPDTFTVSGDKVYAEGLADAKAQSARLRTVLKDWGLDENLGSQYFVQAYQYGYSADQIGEALAELAGKNLSDKSTIDGVDEIKSAYGYISNALNRLANSNGVDRLQDANDRKTVLSKGLDGILAGLSYDYKEERQKNEDFMSKYQNAMLNLKERELAWEKSDDNPRNIAARTAAGKRGGGSGTGTQRTPQYGLRVYDKDGNISRHGKPSDEVGVGTKKQTVLNGYSKVIVGEHGTSEDIKNQLTTQDIKTVAKDLGIKTKTIEYGVEKERPIDDIVSDIEERLEENPNMTIYTTSKIGFSRDGKRKESQGNVAVDSSSPQSIITGGGEERGSATGYIQTTDNVQAQQGAEEQEVENVAASRLG